MTSSVPSGEQEAKAPVKEAFVFPVSFAQQRLWFLDQFEPDSPFYNMFASVLLPGTLNVEALRLSLNALVRRHEALRTTFSVIDDQPAQVIAPSLTLDLAVNDLREMPESVREATAQQIAALEAQKPFDLKRGPLLRAQLIRLGDTDHILLLTIHHIICDGWSMEILFRELAAYYNAYQAGQVPELPELTIQYADFACWQREWLTGPVLQTQLEYWKHQLEGAPALHELPTDRPRPPVQGFRGGQYSFWLSGLLIEALKSLSEQEYATLFMTMLAGFNALLYRYTGQEDLVVGTPIANRVRPELEGLIGFFANTLVLRTRLSADLSFRQLLARVREVTLGAYAHQDIPFEKLVEELGPERNLSYNPLFQLMIAPQNAVKSMPGGGEQQDLTNLTVHTGVAKFDLTVFLTETPQGILVGYEYNTDLFDAETMVRMGEHFKALLTAAADNPDRKLWALAMLSQSEIMTLADWNATQVSFDADCAHKMFEAQAERTPAASAIVFGDESLRYDELNTRANYWAHRMIDLGVSPDTCVGICMERSPEMIVAVLAVLKAGGAYLPLDPNYPQERLAFMMEDSRTPVLLTQSHLAGRLPASGVRVLTLDGEDKARAIEDNPPHVTSLDHLAYVIYTSGSTGHPKGVAMPHRPLANLLGWQIARSALPSGARTLQFASLSFDVSFQEIFSTLCAGGTLVLIVEEDKRDPDAVWQLLRKAEVNRLFLSYVALQQLAERAKSLPGLPTSLREVITAGEQLQSTPQIVRLFACLDCPLYNQYGPSESHVVTEMKLSGPSSAWPARPPIGRPIQNVTVHILDAHGQMVPVGVPGELYIGGAAPARGYIHRQDITAERFVADPDSDCQFGGRLYRTGDRARYLPDGNIEFMGRFDDQVKIRGFRVEPGEIESALRQHKAVREAAVVAKQYGAGEQRLVAYVQADAENPVTHHDLRAHLAALLPDYMLPPTYAVLDTLPLTPSGKLDRRALPEPDNASAAASEFVGPRTPTEETLAKIWSEILRVERVSINDNFFELGGHSLLATRVISRIRDDLHVDLPLRRLFEAPTIERLALLIVQSFIESEGEEEAARLVAELEQISDDQALTLLHGWPAQDD